MAVKTRSEFYSSRKKELEDTISKAQRWLAKLDTAEKTFEGLRKGAADFPEILEAIKKTEEAVLGAELPPPPGPMNKDGYHKFDAIIDGKTVHFDNGAEVEKYLGFKYGTFGRLLTKHKEEWTYQQMIDHLVARRDKGHAKKAT
jgi:hypothetical protein